MDPLSEFLSIMAFREEASHHAEDSQILDEEDCGNDAFFF